MTMRYDDPELRRRLGEAYVLGTLRGAARRRMQRLLTADGALRDDVDALSRRWNRLAETLPPTAPSPALWATIENRIAPPAAATSSAPAARAGFGFWRGWALAATLACGVLGAYLWTAEPPPAYVVVVTDDAESRAGWLLGTDAGGRLTVKNLRPQPLPDGRDFQLWAKLDDREQVIPVGILPASGETVLTLPDEVSGALDKLEKVGVSVEPAGGSPTGQPTTTPLYHGQVSRL